MRLKAGGAPARPATATRSAAARLKAKLPGFKPSTARPFVYAPSAAGKPSTPHYLERFGNNNPKLLSTGQFHTDDVDLSTLKRVGVAFGIDVPNKSGGSIAIGFSRRAGMRGSTW